MKGQGALFSGCCSDSRHLVESAGFQVEKALESESGDVFLARGALTGGAVVSGANKMMIVVVKRIRGSVDKCFEALEKFLWEDHRNIARILGAVEVELDSIIVSEFLCGGDLYHHFQEIGVFPEFLARIYMQDLLAGVSVLHQVGICHRDLKPENCVLDDSGVLKIIDFGIASRFDRVSVLNDVCGSLEYVAPEILFRHPYRGPCVDAWSCGVMQFEMVVGDVPFVVSPESKNEVFEFPSTLVAEAAISVECTELLKQFLCVDPQKRMTVSKALGSDWILQRYTLTADDMSLVDCQSVVFKRLNAIFKEQIAFDMSV